jgi:hypothetical protein
MEKGEEFSRQRADELAEAVEEYFNINHYQMQDADGNDLVIFGMCIRNESGYARKDNGYYKSARITWRGRSKLQLLVAR